MTEALQRQTRTNVLVAIVCEGQVTHGTIAVARSVQADFGMVVDVVVRDGDVVDAVLDIHRAVERRIVAGRAGAIEVLTVQLVVIDPDITRRTLNAE
jgi:hypothetical protein